jgi:hypothetical protein
MAYAKRLGDGNLEEAVCKYLAWESIPSEKETLDLSPVQVRQTETQKHACG